MSVQIHEARQQNQALAFDVLTLNLRTNCGYDSLSNRDVGNGAIGKFYFAKRERH